MDSGQCLPALSDVERRLIAIDWTEDGFYHSHLTWMWCVCYLTFTCYSGFSFVLSVVFHQNNPHTGINTVFCNVNAEMFARYPRDNALSMFMEIILNGNKWSLFILSHPVQLQKSTDLGRHNLLYLKEIGNGWFGKVSSL